MYELHYLQHESYQHIADVLNAEGVRLPMGGSHWCKSSVVRVMYSNFGKAIGRDMGVYA
jgi:spermidine synthase